MHAQRLRSLALALGLSVLLSVLALLGLRSVSAAPAVAPLGVSVSGTATLPGGGLPVPDGTIAWLLAPDPDPTEGVHGVAAVVTSTGAFNFANVAPGNYLVRAVPPDASPYAPSRPMPIQVAGTPLTLPLLTLTDPSVTGTVFAPNGITPANAVVHVYRDTLEVERRTTSGGDFKVGGIPTGTYALVAEPLPDAHHWWSRVVTANVQPASPQFISLTLRAAEVHGVVHANEVSPDPVEGARVHALAANGVLRTDVTGPLGRFALGDLPNGMTATLFVEPPPGLGGLLPPPPVIVNIPDPNPVVFTFTTAPKQVRGAVRTNTGLSVTNALVEAHRLDRYGSNMTLSDGSGAFALALAPGLWAVRVRAISTTVPGNWFESDEPRIVQFDNTPQPEVKFMAFVVLTADATVDGAVQLPGGGAPPFTVTVALHSDEGIGVAAPVDAHGDFSLNVPHGVYRLDVRVASRLFAAPPPFPVRAREATTTVVPTITLIARDALISGTLTDNTSALVPDVPVVVWNAENHATFEARSGPDGVYLTPVYSGTWLVRPAPGSDQPYVYAAEPTSVNVASGQSATADFTLTRADATIHGVLVDQGGTPVGNARGFASALSADESIETGAPVEDGTFDILVPAGTYSVSLHLPESSPYLTDRQAKSAGVSSGGTTTVTFTLLRETASIRGAAFNKRTEESVDVDGRVWARDDGLWTGTDLKAGGLYSLGVTAGVWHLNFAIDPDSPFIKAAGPRNFALSDGQRLLVGLPVVRRDGVLTGTVLLSDGITPARGAIVIAEAVSADIAELTLRATVDDKGRFVMLLPSGLYNVRSTLLHDPGLINPAVKGVFVPRLGAANVTLQYRAPNAAIVGKVASASPISGEVSLWAWSADDGYNATTARVNGTYTLPVLAGELWNVVAVHEGPNAYWITRTVVSVPAPGIVNQNLVLVGPKPKPAPQTVVFDPAQDKHIALADGTRIDIPAGALPATERVVLHITPLARAPHQRNGDVLGLSYAFEAFDEDGEPITQNFNADVIITFHYDVAELLARGLDVNHLRPAYFSTTTDSWTRPDSYVVDESRQEITMEINHFTQMALVGVQSAGYQLYLPLVER